ncbi:MAG: LemA family protein [Candidatus Limnocylindrales bacterium]|nr:LemA family protein [Candidatus Limnocylindrales bacterium]
MEPFLLLIGVALLVVAAVFFVRMYNDFVQRRLRTDGTWAQIDVQLKRRHDLVPNLVAAVKGYMGFEQAVLTRVTETRANAVAAGARGPAEAATAEGALTGALRSLFAVVENYPGLKASENVGALQGQLATTENQIGAARDGYNAAVRDYNTAIATFPAVLMAGTMGFTSRQFFETELEARETPSVQLR